MIAAITGLDFGRFTKSMMLSQGQFAAFLNADANDRAELLEELTGTDIYGRLSERVFEKHKQAKIDLDALHQRASGIELLNEEQRLALAQQIDALSQQEQQLSKEQLVTQNQINWLTGWQQQQQHVQQYQQQQVLVEQEYQQALPGLQRLARSEPAENCARCNENVTVAKRFTTNTATHHRIGTTTAAISGTAHTTDSGSRASHCGTPTATA